MSFIKELEYLKLEFEDIKSATDSFSDEKVIGRGGFGLVYKGELSHAKGRSIVAIKRLDRRFGQGDSEFWKEIMMLSRYTHKNLVSLLGFCINGDEKMLVYEHVSRGSLDNYLSASSGIKWTQRLKICIGAAHGLNYLHDPKGTQQRVLHHDIKSSNILLDENWEARVSDFGLSKLGPANQQYTMIVSNVVGTPAYCDPLYMEMGFLTKESDVYSFGVVLFEVMCGRLCYESGRSLVRIWQQSYEQKQIDKIIHHELRKQMDLNCLNTFSAIAFRCLHRAREDRPTMDEIVKELEIALEIQESHGDVNPTRGYEDIIEAATPPLSFRTRKELQMLLSAGILLNEGKTWFSLNKNGENCEMISAYECVHRYYGHHYQYTSAENSRFLNVKCVFSYGSFIAKVRTQFLSPHIKYTINLVFKYVTGKKTSGGLTYLALKYKLKDEKRPWISYLANEREDGWLMIELYQFTCYKKNVDLEILFKGTLGSLDSTILIQGIEFLPLENVTHEDIVNENKAEMQTTSEFDQETDWKQKLPNDFQQIIKRSKDRQHWTTTKELYFLLCKGFLIDKGEKFFLISESGKKCLMLPARACMNRYYWKRKALPTSRFMEAFEYAYDGWSWFQLQCEIESQMLSPNTTYASYLVYMLEEKQSHFETHVKVSSRDDVDNARYIHLVSPQTPVIKSEVDQNDADIPLYRPKMPGYPKPRNDGWMEVQAWEFSSDTAIKGTMFTYNFSNFNEKKFKSLLIQGVEFRPI